MDRKISLNNPLELGVRGVMLFGMLAISKPSLMKLSGFSRILGTAAVVLTGVVGGESAVRVLQPGGEIQYNEELVQAVKDLASKLNVPEFSKVTKAAESVKEFVDKHVKKETEETEETT